MAIETHIRSILAADADITALVGADVDAATSARIYFTDIKQGTAFPALSMFQISGNRTRTLSGPDGFNAVRMQIDCWSKTVTEGRLLFDAVRLALDGYHGTIASQNIANISMLGERVFYEPDPKLHRISCDAMIWHRELIKVG